MYAVAPFSTAHSDKRRAKRVYPHEPVLSELDINAPYKLTGSHPGFFIVEIVASDDYWAALVWTDGARIEDVRKKYGC